MAEEGNPLEIRPECVVRGAVSERDLAVTHRGEWT
jgi:hypothetical protein